MVSSTIVQERLFSEWSSSTHINGARTISVAESDDSIPARTAKTKAAIKATSARISEIQKKLESMPKSKVRGAAVLRHRWQAQGLLGGA